VLSAAALVGCDQRAMNEPDAFGIHFANDLSQPVVLALCASDRSVNCGHADYQDHIGVGDATAENISPDVRTEWAIEASNGKLLRCVLLYWKYWPGHDETVRLSASPRWATPCPRKTPASAYHS
jgi:hypothetical protein